ncbi:uncharacterized protein [Littorina saxatilis]|uniref:uncharacterized protein isoform X2 n=1 Tax=Littorina saxatilis TaxID=31220 RepID=UPI0038B643C8
MESQTVDDMIAAVMSMGFELKDAKDAMQYGKISTQEAVEWILAGKPGYAASGAQPPTLKLGEQNTSLQPDTRVPFSRPLPVPDSAASDVSSGQPTSPASSSLAEPSTSDTDMEQQVVSRLHLTEERYAQKKNFEEKKREEAQRNAKLEKMQAKREHERVLKEIAEDRKINKMMRMHGPTQSDDTPQEGKATPTSSSTNIGATSSVSSATSSSAAASAICSLQIRLPTGKQLRKKLDKGTTLGEVWKQVLDEAGKETEGHCGFIQPFPRREFTPVEMIKTLEQLGLVPSGSLVLKKEAKQDEPAKEERAAPELEEEEDAVPMNEARPLTNRWQPVEPPQVHQWGRGQALDNDEAADQQDELVDADADADEEEEDGWNMRGHQWGRGQALEGDNAAMDVDEANDNIGDDEEDDDDDNQWAAPQGLGGFGGGGGGFNAGAVLGGMLGMQGGGINPGVFMGVGQRLVPMGAPGAEGYNNRRSNELAAEAAQHRLQQPVPEVLAPSEPSPPLLQVPRLQDTCFALVMERILDPVNPLHTLGSIPQDLSQQILSHLLHEKLLDQKTIKLFLSCFLQRLILDTYTYATNELLYALRLHHSLQILSLHSCPLISDQGLHHIANLKNLKVLNLGLCKQITNKSLKVIAGFPQLHTLSLEETSVTDGGLIQYFAGKLCIRHLNLNRTAVTNDIFPHLQNLENLQLLYLEETKITSLEGVQNLKKLETLNVASTLIPTTSLQFLQGHPTLTQLNFANTDHINGDTALEYLAGLKLRTLCLPDRHTVTSAGLAHITGFLLHTLDLTNYIHVGDLGMEHVGKITSLRKLMLSNTKVTDLGLLELGRLVRLKILYLDRTSVSDSGITVVKAFKQLSELSLSTTSVTSRFLKEGVLHSCQGLTKLNLSRTHVGDSGVAKLKLPYLQLLNLDCTRVHAKMVDTIRANCPALKSVTTANLTPVAEEDEGQEEGDM